MALRRDEDESRHNDWQLSAACRGQDSSAFFPPPHFERKEIRLARERFAKSVCRGCAVKDACLDYALRTHEPHGVWGGLNEFERRAIPPSDRGR
ncbi:MAG: Transcription factor WhiB [Ilumatobacteraceae bacterium]|nr:Transcription factor WhiB [Ilumatobacteraceae bacterium]